MQLRCRVEAEAAPPAWPRRPGEATTRFGALPALLVGEGRARSRHGEAEAGVGRGLGRPKADMAPTRPRLSQDGCK